MFCWGSTTNGELGLGAPEDEVVLLPQYNKFDDTWNIKQIASGLTHTLILTESGKVYSCGNNEVGQLGHDKLKGRPEHIDELMEHQIVQVATGDGHSLALTAWGLVYAWGDNGFGQLGNHTIEIQTNSPKCVKALGSKQVVQIACGSNHSFALTSGGELHGWGLNNNGQLGLCHRDSPVSEPSLLRSLIHVPLVQIACGGQHSAAITRAGHVLTWGSNKYGQLGYTPNNGANSSCIPKSVPNLSTYSEAMKYIALGDSHTVVLDAQGRVWTFGNGRYGQLGHGNFEESSVPRPVFDFIGSKIGQIACGRHHTIVYISTQRQLYACGLGYSGQLGCKTPANRNLPQVVLGPWKSSSGTRLVPAPPYSELQDITLKTVFCGGDVSFACVTSGSNCALDYTKELPLGQTLSIEGSKIKEIIGLQDDEMIEDDLFTYCEIVFNSAVCWNSSFLKNDSKSKFPLDYRLAEDYLIKLNRVDREAITSLLRNGVIKILKDLPKTHPTSEVMNIFVLLPMLQVFFVADNMSTIQTPYALLATGLDPTSLKLFYSLLNYLPTDFIRRLVNIYKEVVINLLNTDVQTLDKEKDRLILVSSLKMLQLLYKANSKQILESKKLVYHEFYIPEIAKNVDFKQDYYMWLQQQKTGDHSHDSRILFCQYSFLFDPKAKTQLLHVDATRQMEGAIIDAARSTNLLFQLVNPQQIHFLNLIVRRDHLVQDTIDQIKTRADGDLKRPIKVTFLGEEAYDAGGVTKEFFILLIREILNPDYGMFVENPETYNLWFREGPLESDEMFNLIGIICGLAIYNWTIINVPFPLVLYKKLLNEQVSLDDLADLDPTLLRSLRSLLEYEGDDVEDTFFLKFSVEQNFFGEIFSIPLKEGHENTSVTSENKQEYVKLFVDYKLNKGIEKQYRAFHNGFHRVCGGGILKLFQPIELKGLVTGNEDYDWDIFESNTEYKDYTSDDLTIKYFWEVFHNFPLESKKKFLLFLTGTDRVPILGMKAVKMQIQRTSNENFLPVAHTCMALLDLPAYNTKEKLAYKLGQAIQQCQGFGLV